MDVLRSVARKKLRHTQWVKIKMHIEISQWVKK